MGMPYNNFRGGRVSDGRFYAPNRPRTDEEQLFYMDAHRIGPNSIGAPKDSIFSDGLFDPF